jgi:hypothetical protein
MIVPWNIIELALDFHGDGGGRSRQGIRPHVTTLLAQRCGSHPEPRADMDDIASRVIAAKGFDAGDGILRAAIRDQVGDVIKRFHRRGEVEKIGRGRATRWKLYQPA